MILTLKVHSNGVKHLGELQVPVGVICWIGEAVNVNIIALSMIDLTNPGVQLVIGDAAPVRRLLVVNGLGTVEVSVCPRIRIHLHAIGVHSAIVPWAVGRWRRFRSMAEGVLKIKNIYLENKEKGEAAQKLISI